MRLITLNDYRVASTARMLTLSATNQIPATGSLISDGCFPIRPSGTKAHLRKASVNLRIVFGVEVHLKTIFGRGADAWRE
jgi:hypothetical protein